MIPSEAKVEWSKSPSGSVEEIEAKSSIQPFAWSPLRQDWPIFQMNQTSIPHSSKRYGHLSRLHTPFRSFYSCLKNDPIGPLLLMDILSRPPRVNTPRSDRELFKTLSFTWLGQSFSLPSTEYKKPYSYLTCWHPGEESHYLCHILEFDRTLSCYLSNYRHWSDRARGIRKDFRLMGSIRVRLTDGTTF